jgi:hypothetical protein
MKMREKSDLFKYFRGENQRFFILKEEEGALQNIKGFIYRLFP